MTDRTKRLTDSVITVKQCALEKKKFLEEYSVIFTCLRRGVSDLKKNPEMLDAVQDKTEVLNFLLDVFAHDLKYGKQVLSCIHTLVESGGPTYEEVGNAPPSALRSFSCCLCRCMGSIVRFFRE